MSDTSRVLGVKSDEFANDEELSAQVRLLRNMGFRDQEIALGLLFSQTYGCIVKVAGIAIMTPEAPQTSGQKYQNAFEWLLKNVGEHVHPRTRAMLVRYMNFPVQREYIRGAMAMCELFGATNIVAVDDFDGLLEGVIKYIGLDDLPTVKGSVCLADLALVVLRKATPAS